MKDQPTPIVHGGPRLAAVTVDAYNSELRAGQGFVGDRASRGAFVAILEKHRERLREVGDDPLGSKPSDELSKKKRLPWGIDKDEFAGAKAGLETMKTEWAEATDEFKSGDKVDAAQKARSVKGMGVEISEKLKIEKA